MNSANKNVTAGYVVPPPDPILTVMSFNPGSGVSVTVSPNDKNGFGSGVTQFTRTYNPNATVTLTAPTTSGGNDFYGWTGCDVTSGTTCTVTMNSATKNVSAIYSLAFRGSNWVNLGPAPIVGSSQNFTGRVTVIAVDPGNLNRWLIGAAQGGVWQTLDAGSTWAPLTDSQASLAMGAIAFTPSNPSIIYAGTGEPNRSTSFAGAGLLKSTNGGNSWTLLGSVIFAQTSFSDIKVNPTNPEVVLVGTTIGRAGRNLSSPPSPPARGIFKSTDGGLTWSRKLGEEASALEANPSDFTKQYAAIGNFFGGASNGVYRSTDEGETWTLISGPWSAMTGGVGRVALAISPSNPNTLYVSIQDALDGMGNDLRLLGLFRTDNAWDPAPTWSRIPTGATDDGSGTFGYCGWDTLSNRAKPFCEYSHKILVDPTNASTLYAAGVNLWKCTSCTSTKAVWTDINGFGSGTGLHGDQHTLARAGSRLIAGNDGGVWSSTNAGGTWTNHNTNLAITQFQYGALHPTDANFVLGGSWDNGMVKWTGTNTWSLILDGDTAAIAISLAKPETDWAVAYQLARKLTIARTLDGGASFTAADSGIDYTGTFSFATRFEKCPANDNVFIAGTGKLWRSNNFFKAGTPVWSDNNSGLFNSGILTLAFAPSDPTCNTYVFGTNGGDLRLTTNGGATWADIDSSNGVPNRSVTGLAFDPTNANVLYVTLSSFDEVTPGQPGHVFKSTNVLSTSPTWSNVSPPVNIPHNTIVVDPSDANIVCTGTDLGVWGSRDGGSSWTHMGPEVGMPNVAVFDLKIHAATGKVFAFTFGRGAFVFTPLPSVTISDVTATEGNSGTTPFDFTVKLSRTSSQSVTVTYSTADGTATAGSDYVAASGTITFNPGETTKRITVQVNGNTVYEPNETFFVNLTSASNATITDGQGLGTTIDDDTIVLVSCTSESLQGAIDSAVAGQTVAVTGNCNENILIRNEKQRITIDGAGGGIGTRATVNGSGASPTFNVRGKGILIQNFTITGGSNGVRVNRGSNAVLNNNVIQNSEGDGVLIDELAFSVVTNNVIQGHVGAGVVVGENSTARIGFNADSDTIANPNTIQSNAEGGVIVSNGSSARVIGNNIVNNTGDGILVVRDSFADIANNALSGNGGDGIEVAENSVVQLGEDTGTSIYETPNITSNPNTGFGIKCSEGGIADGRTGTLTGSAGAKSFVGGGCIDSLIP
jgi:hypothetical protein